MKGLIITFLFTLVLIIGSYGLMIGAIGLPPREAVPGPLSIVAPARSEARATATGNHLSHQAMEQVIDCYAGKPVFLDPDNSRPLYPSCDQLLRIYQGQTTDPHRVLILLAEAAQPKQ